MNNWVFRVLAGLLALAAVGCTYSEQDFKSYEGIIPRVLTERGFTVHETESGKYVAKSPQREWFGDPSWVRVTARIVEGPDGFYEADVKAERRIDDSGVRPLGFNTARSYPVSVARLTDLEVELKNDIERRFADERRRRARKQSEKDERENTKAPGPSRPGDGAAPTATPTGLETEPAGSTY